MEKIYRIWLSKALVYLGLYGLNTLIFYIVGLPRPYAWSALVSILLIKKVVRHIV